MKTPSPVWLCACVSGALLLPPCLGGETKSGAAEDSSGESSANNGDWCTWLSGDPGLLYESKKNPWIQSFEVGGRFHYQVASLEGRDVNGLEFNDTYDEYRRLRIETQTTFLRYFVAEVNANLVSDNRFRDGLVNDLEWGYDRFDEVSVEFDLGKAFGDGWLDGIKLKYGRMKLKIGSENTMSSNNILTIERSGIADKLGGEASRPTGATVQLDKGDWRLTLGVFSAEDDSDFIAGWGEGEFYYASLRWRPDNDLTVMLDYVQNNHHGGDDALGYSWASALSATYSKKHWGVIAEAIYGDNGGGASASIPRRQGDFHAFIVSPWYWVVEDKLQAVVQYQYAESEESQGLQLSSRYLRAKHDNGAVDVDNGRGSEHHSLYAGLNWHLCRDRVKVMGGVSLDRLETRSGDVRAHTWQLAVRTRF